MFGPRSIVRASVVALSAAVVASSAISAQAAEETFSPKTRVEAPAVVESVPMEFTPTAADAAARAQVAKRVSRGATRMHANFRQANSKLAKDMQGVERSAYTGKFFTKSGEDFRKCVVKRESHAYYKVVGGGDLTGDGKGDYQGAYQLSPALARGATFMMAKESKKAKDGLLPVIKKLRNKPANKWNRYWQDRAFFTILNWDGQNSGKQHWAGGRYHC